MPILSLYSTRKQTPSRFPQCEQFALPIPTCWYPKRLADPTQTPTRAGAKVPNAIYIVCIGHFRVGIALGMSISCLLPFFVRVVTQCEPGFLWNMGLTTLQMFCHDEQLRSVLYNMTRLLSSLQLLERNKSPYLT